MRWSLQQPPVLLTGRCPHRLSRPHRADLTVAIGDQADAVGADEELTVGVGVPVGARLRGEAIAHFEPRLAAGTFTPAVASSYDLDDFVAAYAEVEANPSMGRIIAQP